jgi:hypothetical protein
MRYGEILATVLGEENTYGTVSARAMPNPLTYARKGYATLVDTVAELGLQLA